MSATTAPNHHQTVVNRRDAYRASVEGDWDIVHKFYTTQIQISSSAVNASGDTILHLLILNHHTCIVLKLFHYFSSSTENYHHLLLAQNTDRNTALHEAVRIGSMEIVAALVEKEESLVSIPNTLGETALYWAAAYGKMDMLCFLFKKNSEDNVLTRRDFSTILHAAVAAEFYGLAIKINELCPSLAWARDKQGITALHLMVKSPASFRSGTFYTYQNIGTSPFIPTEILAIVVYMCLPSYTYPTRDAMIRNMTEISGIKWLIRCKAEEWVKDMSNTLMVISTLIAAINFQAAFTVPGGNESDKDNSNKGYPIFLKRKYFIPHLFFLSISLFASLLSLGAALSAHLSIFNLEDYYYFLPWKLLIGGNAFFISALSFVWAYALGLYLESSPTTNIFQMVVGHCGVWDANLLTLMMYVDIMYPIFRSVLRSLIHSLTYHGRGL